VNWRRDEARPNKRLLRAGPDRLDHAGCIPACHADAGRVLAAEEALRQVTVAGEDLVEGGRRVA